MNGDSNKIITFLSDFGTKDATVACCKGVILSINPNAKIIDITHEIKPFSITEGSWLLSKSVSYFPRGSIHLAVVDPGKYLHKKAIVIKTKKKNVLVGPDNGILIDASAKLGGIEEVREIKNPKFMLKHISHIFRGRDIFSPTAAKLSIGEPLSEVGPLLDKMSLTNSPIPKVHIHNKGVEGTVVFIDPFGSINTNIPWDSISPRFKERREITIEGKKHYALIVKDFSEGKDGLILLQDSWGYAMIAVSMRSAALLCKAKVGDKVLIKI